MSGELRLASQTSTESFDLSPVRIVNSSDLFFVRSCRGVDAKRVLDIVLSATLLVFSAVPIAVMALVVALDGGNPFFGHERVGRDGRRFRCWKIRTMHHDAEARLHELLRCDPASRRQWEADRKLAADPRTTRLGRLLRRTSFDELPQLWNVLVGEMSLVGPRPVTRDELPLYGRSIGHYCAGRPGLTGRWQVCRRPDTSYAERVAIDRAYVETRTLLEDLVILARTLRAPFVPTGR